MPNNKDIILNSPYLGDNRLPNTSIARTLVGFHGRIVKLFGPLPANKKDAVEIIERVGLVFSILFVYPLLGVLVCYGKFAYKPKKKVSALARTVADNAQTWFEYLKETYSSQGASTLSASKKKKAGLEGEIVAYFTIQVKIKNRIIHFSDAKVLQELQTLSLMYTKVGNILVNNIKKDKDLASIKDKHTIDEICLLHVIVEKTKEKEYVRFHKCFGSLQNHKIEFTKKDPEIMSVAEAQTSLAEIGLPSFEVGNDKHFCAPAGSRFEPIK